VQCSELLLINDVHSAMYPNISRGLRASSAEKCHEVQKDSVM